VPCEEGPYPPFGPGVLASEIAGGTWSGSAGDYWHDIFPEQAWHEKWFDEMAFGLLYVAHGGSGLNLSLRDIEEMPVSEIEWWSERLGAQREADAAAIREAAKEK